MKTISVKKQGWIFAAVIIGIVAFDQLVKYLAQAMLAPGQQHVFIPGFMNFTYVENTGAAMSLFAGISGSTAVLAVISTVMAGVVIYILYRVRNIDSWLLKLSLCFIAGGAIGNLLDRAFRGYVVDMLLFDTKLFPYVFNVGDSFVCVGAVMLGIFVIWFWDKNKKKDDAADGKQKD